MKRRRAAPGPYLLHLELVRDRVPNGREYPFNLPAVRSLTTLDFHPNVTFFVGENGSGKSTLLEAIAVASGLNAEGGSRNFNFDTRASHSALHQCLRLARAPTREDDAFFLRAESFYNVATYIERLDAEPAPARPIINSYGGDSLHEQSHGESFFSLIRHRFRDRGLYFMDEPEAALSPTRQLQFLVMLDGLVRSGGQFVIATHSPIILAYPHSRLYVFDETGIHETSYEETEHYKVTKNFLSSPERMLKRLLDDEPNA